MSSAAAAALVVMCASLIHSRVFTAQKSKFIRASPINIHLTTAGLLRLCRLVCHNWVLWLGVFNKEHSCVQQLQVRAQTRLSGWGLISVPVKWTALARHTGNFMSPGRAKKSSKSASIVFLYRPWPQCVSLNIGVFLCYNPGNAQQTRGGLLVLHDILLCGIMQCVHAQSSHISQFLINISLVVALDERDIFLIDYIYIWAVYSW